MNLSVRPAGHELFTPDGCHPPTRIIQAPILSVFYPFRPAPVAGISSQPAPLTGGDPPLLAKNLGTTLLAWVTARIRLEPFFARETFFLAMFF